MNDFPIISTISPLSILTHTDILGLIIGNNINLTLVCKDVYQTVLNNSIICPDCHKIIKIYNHVQWLTDSDDDQCHGCHFTHFSLDEYKEIKSILTTYPKYLKLLTPYQSLYKYAIKQHPNAIKYINQTPELSLFAVQCNNMAIKYIKNQTLELCQLAIQNPRNFQYIQHKTIEICKQSLSHYDNIRYINNEILEQILTQSIVHQILNSDSSLIEYIPLKFQTDEVCEFVIKKDPKLIHYIKYRKEYYYRMLYTRDKNYFNKLFHTKNLENTQPKNTGFIVGNFNIVDNGAIGIGINNYGNVAMGHNTLIDNIGSNNTALGINSGYRCESKNDNLFICNKGQYQDNGVIKIGNNKHVKNYQAGIYNNNIHEGYPVYITKDGQLGIKKI
jgi:hypothetical protein